MINTFYLGFDLTLLQQQEFISAKRKIGHEGIGIFFEICLKLAITENYKLKIESIDDIAFDIHCDPNKLKKLIFDFDIFEKDHLYFWSKSVFEKMENLDRLREKKSKAGKVSAQKRMEKSTQTEQNSTGVEQVFEQNSTGVEQYNIIQPNIIENNINEKERVETPAPPKKINSNPDLNKFMELSKQYLPEILDSPILYSIWNAVRTYEDWEEYFIWGCENKKDKKETIYKDIAWKDWFRKDYHIAKLAKEKDKEPSYDSNYPHQTYEREVEPQLTDEQIEENKKHMAEMLKTLKINLKKV